MKPTVAGCRFLGKQLLLLLVVTLGTFLLLEGSVRCLRLAPPLGASGSDSVQRVLEFDAKLESRYKPNAHTTVSSQYGEFTIDYSFNELGLRGHSLVSQAAPDGLRVLALGNSFVEGWGTDVEATFLAIAERQLQHQLGRPIQLINAGASGYGACQCYLLYQELVDRIKPDAVLFFYIPTMVSADHQFEPRARKDSRGLVTGLDMDRVLQGGAGKAEPLPSIAQGSPWLRAGTVYSHVVRLLVGIIDGRRARGRIVPGDPRSDLLAAYRADPEQLSQLHGCTFRHIEALAQDCARQHRPFLVVTLPMPFEVSEVEWQRGRAIYQLKSERDSYRPTHELAITALRQAKVPWVSAHEFLQEQAAQKPGETRIFYNYDFHLNPRGNKLLGEWLAEELATRADFFPLKAQARLE